MNDELMIHVPGFKAKRPGKILELCEHLSPVMNEIHRKNYSTRFWTTLLKYYATTCVNREGLLSGELMDTKPFLLPINAWELPTRQQVKEKNILYLGKVFLKNSGLEKVHQILKNHENICLGPRGKELADYGIGAFCPTHYPLLIKGDRTPRRKLLKIAGRVDSIFMRNVIMQIPKFYVEFFEKVHQKIKVFNPEKKVFHAEHIPLFMELLVALYVENGSKFYNYQLGGFIGETKTSLSPVKYRTIDKHRTYGWKIHEKDEPHFAYRLESFKKTYQKANPGFLASILLCYNSINAKNKKRYADLSRFFFNNINTQKYSRILLRPRGVSRKMDNSKQLAFLQTPKFVQVDKGMKPMAEITKGAEIVVHWNHPSTNFLECVFVDHPVVAILTNDEPTEIIKPYYAFFLEQKVMHKNIESLLDHLNQTDIPGWWARLTQMPEYKEFKNKFARPLPVKNY